MAEALSDGLDRLCVHDYLSPHPKFGSHTQAAGPPNLPLPASLQRELMHLVGGVGSHPLNHRRIRHPQKKIRQESEAAGVLHDTKDDTVESSEIEWEPGRQSCLLRRPRYHRLPVYDGGFEYWKRGEWD